MAEVITSEFSKFRSDLVDAHATMKAWLWDCGPDQPELPDAPEPPAGKDGDPKFDLAKLQYKRALRVYEEGLEKFERDEKAFKEWERNNGGPIELLFWSTDARDALFFDKKAVEDKRQAKRRYYISLRNGRPVIEMLQRFGHVALKQNGGLPNTMRPGHGHQANIERQIAGEKEFVEQLKSDPQFGQEMRA